VDRTRDWYRAAQAVERIAASVPKFNSYDFEAILLVKKWKRADNEFHFWLRNRDTHKYSRASVDAIIASIADDPTLRTRARASLRAARAADASKKS